MFKIVLVFLSLLISTSVFAADEGYRFIDGKCQKDGVEGLNPTYFGQCGDFRGTVIRGVTLDGEDLRGSNFESADLQTSIFENTDLRDTNFEGSVLYGTSFVGANLTNSNMKKSFLSNTTSFGNATMRGVNLSEIQAENLLFSYLDLSSAIFDSANLKGSSFELAILEGASFKNSILAKANFENSQLRKATITNSDLRGGNFKKADTTETEFKGSKFSKKTKFDFSQEEALRRGLIFISLFEFTGVLKNVSISEMTGWKICHQALYDQRLVSTQVLRECRGEQVMIACKLADSDLLQIAANGLYEKVFRSDPSNVGTIDNGVKFYFSDSRSLGFANMNTALSRNSCDTGDTQPDERLCFHTDSNSGGWRCGASTNLNGSKDYERLIFVSE